MNILFINVNEDNNRKPFSLDIERSYRSFTKCIENDSELKMINYLINLIDLYIKNDTTCDILKHIQNNDLNESTYLNFERCIEKDRHVELFKLKFELLYTTNDKRMRAFLINRKDVRSEDLSKYMIHQTSIMNNVYPEDGSDILIFINDAHIFLQQTYEEDFSDCQYAIIFDKK